MPSMGAIKAAQEISRRLDELIPNWDKGLRAALDAQKKFFVSQSAALAMQDAAKIQPIAAQIFEAYRRMAPLMNHPALREVKKWSHEINSQLFEQKTPSSSLPPATEDSDLCTAVDVLVEKVESQGMKEDELPDKKTFQDAAFIFFFYASTLNHRDLLNWLRKLYEASLKLLEIASQAPTVSGISNTYFLFDVSRSVCAMLYQVV